MSEIGRLGMFFTALVLALLVSMSTSILVLLPLAVLAGFVVLDVARHGPRRTGLAGAALAFVSLIVLNMAALVPAERLVTFECWRWHGRVLLAPLVLGALLITPTSVRAGTLRRGIRIMATVMAVVGVWGYFALAWSWVPKEVTVGDWTYAIIREVADREWFQGTFRHHEVAGGAYALASLYTLSILLNRGEGKFSRVWGLLFAGNVLGLVASVARAYLGGFAIGAAALALLSLRMTDPAHRRSLRIQVVLAATFCAATLLSTPEIGNRLAVLFGLGSGPLEEQEVPARSMLDLYARLGEVELFSEAPGRIGQGPEDDSHVDHVRELIDALPVERRTLWDRLLFWRASWDGFVLRPLAGFGISSFPIHFRGHEFLWSQHNPEHNTHNNVLQILVDGGLAGLVAVLWWVILLVARLWRRAGSAGPAGGLALGCLAGMVCLAAAGMFDSNFYSPTLMLPIVVPAALLLREDAPRRRNTG